MIKNKFTISLVFLFSALALFSSFNSEKSKTDFLVTITTDYGDMKLILFDDTPIHKTNFIKLAEDGKYDGSTFHRVINNFMVQGGELDHSDNIAWDTTSFDKKTLPSEILENHKHIFGALAAARTENPEKRSDISQFYIVQNHNGTHFLDNNYTVYGQLIVGFDVLDSIAMQKVVASAPVKKCSIKVRVEKVKRDDIIKFYGDVYRKYNVNNPEEK